MLRYGVKGEDRGRTIIERGERCGKGEQMLAYSLHTTQRSDSHSQTDARRVREANGTRCVNSLERFVTCVIVGRWKVKTESRKTHGRGESERRGKGKWGHEQVSEFGKVGLKSDTAAGHLIPVWRKVSSGIRVAPKGYNSDGSASRPWKCRDSIGKSEVLK
jgi:hypothetical protein